MSATPGDQKPRPSPARDPAIAVLSRTLFMIRGIAIALVVAGHVIGFSRENGMRQAYDSDLGLLGKFCDLLNTFHMPVFFVASGIAFFLFSKKDTGVQTFIVSKFSKLLIPLLIWSPLYFLMQHLVKHQPFTVGEVFGAAIFPYEIFWFIHALLFCTALSYVVFKVSRSRALYLLLSAVPIGLYVYFKPADLSVFESYLFWNVFYAFGVLIAPILVRFSAALDEVPAATLLAIDTLLLAIMVHVVFNTSKEFEPYQRVVNGPAGFFFLFVAVYFGERVLRTFKLPQAVPNFVANLGIASMAVYLFHSYFTRGTALAVQKFLHLPTPILYFAIVLTAGVLGPFLLNAFLEPRSAIYNFTIGGVRKPEQKK